MPVHATSQTRIKFRRFFYTLLTAVPYAGSLQRFTSVAPHGSLRMLFMSASGARQGCWALVLWAPLAIDAAF
jgi:hypothetical protein